MRIFTVKIFTRGTLLAAIAAAATAAALLLSGCANTIQRQQKPLTGEGVSHHTLAKGDVELSMKISSLTSNVWITTELLNQSANDLELNTAELIAFENNQCIEVRDAVTGSTEPLKPQERRLFRASYFWKGKRKSDPLYDTCKQLPIRFTITGLKLQGEAVTAPNWTVTD